MANFTENLEKLEQITMNIKRNDVSLEDALKSFEEGIKLAKSLEKEVDKIEGKIQQLMNNPSVEANTEPQIDLFYGLNEDGSSGAPVAGTRQ